MMRRWPTWVASIPTPRSVCKKTHLLNIGHKSTLKANDMDIIPRTLLSRSILGFLMYRSCRHSFAPHNKAPSRTPQKIENAERWGAYRSKDSTLWTLRRGGAFEENMYESINFSLIACISF